MMANDCSRFVSFRFLFEVDLCMWCLYDFNLCVYENIFWQKKKNWSCSLACGCVRNLWIYISFFIKLLCIICDYRCVLFFRWIVVVAKEKLWWYFDTGKYLGLYVLLRDKCLFIQVIITTDRWCYDWWVLMRCCYSVVIFKLLTGTLFCQIRVFVFTCVWYGTALYIYIFSISEVFAWWICTIVGSPCDELVGNFVSVM